MTADLMVSDTTQNLLVEIWSDEQEMIILR